jgi:PAS domain S-box-containing protein
LDPRSLLAENDALRRRVSELEAAEQKFEMLFRANIDACYLARFNDGQLVDCSDQFLVLFGYERDELQRKTATGVSLYADPNDRDRVLALLQEHGILKDLELRGRRRNGDTFPATLSAYTLQVGDVPHILGIVRDITEQKQAYEAMKRSELKYRSLVDTTDTGFIILDTEGRVVDANAEYVRMTGHERIDEILGRSVLEWTAAAAQETNARALQQCVERGFIRGFETSYVDRQGGIVAMEVSATMVRTEAGDQLLGLCRDITARKRVERELLRRETTLKQAGQMAHLGAWEVELVGSKDIRPQTITWSDEVFRIFGYAPGSERLTVQQFYDHVHPEDLDRVNQAEAEALAAKRPYSVEHRIVRTDGTVRVMQEHAELEFDERGQLARLIGAVQDITEVKRTENELRAANARLVELDQRKNEFLGMLSHELRNPLAPISNSLFILERAAPGGDQARRALVVIERQVRHLTHLVDDLLDVTRISRGKIRLQPERLDLNEVAVRTVEDFRSLFVKAGVNLEVLPAPSEVWVDGDKTRLAQAVGNLLQNAAKFTHAGGKTTISIEADVSRAQAILTVRDTGIGLAPEIMPRLFNAFAQADETLDRSQGGLGLGLALVKGLVELHGGSVDAASEGSGKGAVFTIRLPLATASVTATTDRHTASGAGTPHRILVIEDNIDAADSLREVLELSGHVVVVAHNGPQGIERARTLRPDVVLCDIGLPGMDGHAVARTLRADPELGRVALVAVSGYAGPDDVAKAREAGFDAHLAKPPSMEALERVLATRPPQ